MLNLNGQLEPIGQLLKVLLHEEGKRRFSAAHGKKVVEEVMEKKFY